ncbi:FecR family protein [Echinicola sp. CAU 1574]|uniref:FecR family protein n=1 Tax=Echinicola arenosa TaxID=2774144 RepID=A0ABR9AK16_9BACT|nr:FecR family protein [Echinicola arenosa]MBD8489146.1 FecR family protein [Echinicola arenosa]
MDESKLLKYFEGTATGKETEDIEAWFQISKSNEDRFYQLKAQYIASKFKETSDQIDLNSKWKQFQIKTQNKSIYKFRSPLLKYAASIILVVGLGALFYLFQGIYDQSPIPYSDDKVITLQLGNGETILMEESGQLSIKNSKGQVIGNQLGGRLTYLSKKGNNDGGNPSFNTLKVPYAKRFEVILPDGSEVTLNAGSSLTYPTSFDHMETRSVTLSGEAFFKVKKDADQPFIVKADLMNIRVLGTEFNVSSYPEDPLVQTALVEGKVSIYNNDSSYDERATVLLPGELANWDKSGNEIQVKKTELDMYTAWLSGKIIFRNISFPNIIKKLERHYDVEIVNSQGTFETEYYSASFDVETIDEVMETFKRAYGLQYEIKGNKIFIHH